METQRKRTEKLRSLVTQAGGIAAFARQHNGIDPTYISQLLNRHRSFGERAARNMEAKIGVKPGWFDIEEETANIEPVSIPGMVPVISWVAAGIWTPMSDQTVEPLEWLPCPVKHGKGTYALIVRGQSMCNPTGERSFKDGDIIFVDPTLDAQNKDFVIARLDNESEATFKKLIVEDGQKMLMAINPDWKPKFISINGNASILGVVIGKVERWR
ncbi:S24 family peptidase [Oxalobacter aliiformigenes]|uniref:LexA family protein n=1 Tax=Oxalobacter aliiformigenes TaxID=2946593 RepID=UPI0022B03B6B|nr:S24 family peptidase [Oxalobacter aliiformigenes]MCZ4064099.1 S24 family peptidase [Oxalobacter aliiformigenes]WAV99476.1 S24 family peptidase [Oxalobacter aliiformigenes]